MSEQSKYHFPEFITRELSNGNPMSENEMRMIDDIYQKAENFTYPASKTEANWQKIKTRMTLPDQQITLKVSRNKYLSSFTKWAVAAVIILSASFGIFQFYNKPATQIVLEQSTEGSLKKVILTDGSIVTLNTFSTLTVNDFKSAERIVTLSGEAYFEVIHNDKPFIVKTPTGTIKVLGTKFNIKSRKNAPFQVALSSGKISFNTSKGHYEMEPGDVITQTLDNTFIKSGISNATLSWLDQKLVFENETLSNIINALENQYNIALEYDSKLKDEKLTLTFDKLTAQQAAELLSKTLNSRVVVK